MVSSYDGDLDELIADFTGDLRDVLNNNGITDASIVVVDISYTADNE